MSVPLPKTDVPHFIFKYTSLLASEISATSFSLILSLHENLSKYQNIYLFIFLLCFVGNEGGFDELSTTESPTLSETIKYNMRKSLDLEQEGCYLEVGKKECLEECGFNVTAKTIFIIHGWTVIYSSGIYTLSYFFFLYWQKYNWQTPSQESKVGRM